VSHLDDDLPEMATSELDDAAADALLTGRNVPVGFASVAAFAAAARGVADGPMPVPSAALQQIFADGLSPTIDAAPAPVVAGSGVERAAAAARPRAWRRRRMAVAELLTSLGMGAKVLLGVGVAGASVTAAGAAGVLPDPVQHAVARTVNAATPFEVPDDGTTTTTGQPFGATVSSYATDDTPGVDGATISSLAHEQGHGDDTTDSTDSDATDPEGTETTGEAATTSATTPATTSATTPAASDFGRSVASDATDDTPGVDGQTISSEARDRPHGASTPPSTVAPSTPPSTGAPSGETDVHGSGHGVGSGSTTPSPAPPASSGGSSSANGSGHGR
jgi:hypothetical protein